MYLRMCRDCIWLPLLEMMLWMNQKPWEVTGCLNRLSNNAFKYFVLSLPVIIFKITIIIHNYAVHVYSMGWDYRAYCSSIRWCRSMESYGGMIPIEDNERTQRKTCPRATLSTTNPTWSDPGANPGLHGERPMINHLSHGATYVYLYYIVISTDNARLQDPILLLKIPNRTRKNFAKNYRQFGDMLSKRFASPSLCNLPFLHQFCNTQWYIKKKQLNQYITKQTNVSVL
jgi:hypothetical protein